MTQTEFLYSYYDQELVDNAIAATPSIFNRSSFDSIIELAALGSEDNDKILNKVYNSICREMAYAYLHGAKYAVDSNLSTTLPSSNTFSDFHKSIDFAVLFDFADNDFGSPIEAGAKLYCQEFNRLLHQIDMYDDHDYMKSTYIKEFEELCNIENIKEIMKCGFMSNSLERLAEVRINRMPVANDAINEVKKDLDYIPWDGTKIKWEKVDDKYVKSGELNRFITGTNEEIANAVKDYSGNIYEETNGVDFPYWCNGEVIILYMKNGYLTYATR